ncbi:fatty acid elongase [Dissophora ornata]|nr:fatty acid elongase [Dissophora ornata]
MLSIIESGPRPVGIPFPEYYDFFMYWKMPFTVAGAYCIAVTLLNPKVGRVSRVVARDSNTNVKVIERTESGHLMTAFVLVHNVILCIYSPITFYNMAPAMVENIARTHFLMRFWNNALGYWGYLFYLSKFYEIIDTIIIILKGRRSSLLQTYHHAGAMITMWSGIKYQSNPIWLFVVLNSFIHTIMYCYYACTSIGLHPPGKKYLTSMQTTQFLLGMAIALTYLSVPGCVTTRGAQLSVWVNVAYLFPLTYLFVDFAKRTYSKRGSPTDSTTSSSSTSSSRKKTQ